MFNIGNFAVFIIKNSHQVLRNLITSYSKKLALTIPYPQGSANLFLQSLWIHQIDSLLLVQSKQRKERHLSVSRFSCNAFLGVGSNIGFRCFAGANIIKITFELYTCNL